ncbi:MAG: efflux RND transporter periplasmic adaptor subunit [Isosphaeraceae bacterium]|jgi:cobalt-zinc-cadmium efflux system membrane fusion protein
MKISWKLTFLLAVMAGIGAWLTLDHGARGRVENLWRKVSNSSAHAEDTRSSKVWFPESSSKVPWDHTIVLAADQSKGIGLRTVAVEQQTLPTLLRLSGITDYDPATLTVVRSQFDSRVDKVLVDLGSVVKPGDPLLELFSTDLAVAKNDYETAVSQHARDKKVLEYKAPLAETNAIPRKDLIEAQNDEAKSNLQMKLAKDKLLVFGLTEKEIADVPNEDGVKKAKMILRSRAAGIVIKRSVVRGNYYDSKDELMQIAPLEHLWVRGNVSELDADKVQVGQRLTVVFPYSSLTIDGKVEYIDKAIDMDTRSAKFRASIPNPEGRLKAGMFVRVLLEVSPKEGQTVIPRGAMVSVDRVDYVFAKQPGKNDKFERRPIVVAKENNDFVVVSKPSPGNPELKPGDEVVATGSLILEQMYEDRVMVEGEFLSTQPELDEKIVPLNHHEVSISVKP